MTTEDSYEKRKESSAAVAGGVQVQRREEESYDSISLALPTLENCNAPLKATPKPKKQTKKAHKVIRLPTLDTNLRRDVVRKTLVRSLKRYFAEQF